MTTMQLTRKRTVPANHRMREWFAGLSTGSGKYYETIYEWWDIARGILRAYGLDWAYDWCPQVFTDEGRGLLALSLIDGGEELNTQVFWTWHRMDSGRWEIICYLT